MENLKDVKLKNVDLKREKEDTEKQRDELIRKGKETKKELERLKDSELLLTKVQQNVGRLQNSIDGVEASLTCSVCMSPFEGPVSLANCGHTFCSECVSDQMMHKDDDDDRNLGMY
eukprot:CAMPEP_0115042004 /NCGR_PEP_ID=MMETSP0216-20121206/46009_1 /TAXON_ID=223996 /ORGANISM="Protocruzia adherens, Strain Boccale" /LENGTH=115 /DNA_ID=CAMNT_0002424039 /DNA_START=1 /DNA_END=348 /DNA_ORIENTATION=+